MAQLQTQYTTFTNLRSQQGLRPVSVVPALKDPEKNALNQIKSGSHKLLGVGLVGTPLQEANSTFLRFEKVDRLAKGEFNAVNLQAAFDLSQEFSQGEVQQVLGQVSAPLATVVSIQSLGSSIQKTLENPNAGNVKGLITTTRGATTTVGHLSGVLAEVGVEYGLDAGKFLARGSQFLGRITPTLNKGIAVMDIILAAQDVRHYWQDPSGKNVMRMGLGMVAAGASIVRATNPALGTTATIVAALADVGKLGLDVDWQAAATGGRQLAKSVLQSGQERVRTELGLDAQEHLTTYVSLRDLATH